MVSTLAAWFAETRGRQGRVVKEVYTDGGPHVVNLISTGRFFFFPQKHKQQQLTAHPVFFLPPRSQGIIKAYKSPPDDIKLLE